MDFYFFLLVGCNKEVFTNFCDLLIVRIQISPRISGWQMILVPADLLPLVKQPSHWFQRGWSTWAQRSITLGYTTKRVITQHGLVFLHRNLHYHCFLSFLRRSHEKQLHLCFFLLPPWFIHHLGSPPWRHCQRHHLQQGFPAVITKETVKQDPRKPSTKK